MFVDKAHYCRGRKVKDYSSSIFLIRDEQVVGLAVNDTPIHSAVFKQCEELIKD